MGQPRGILCACAMLLRSAKERCFDRSSVESMFDHQSGFNPHRKSMYDYALYLEKYRIHASVNPYYCLNIL